MEQFGQQPRNPILSALDSGSASWAWSAARQHGIHARMRTCARAHVGGGPCGRAGAVLMVAVAAVVVATAAVVAVVVVLVVCTRSPALHVACCGGAEQR